MCAKETCQNHCVGNLLDQQRVPLDASLALKLIFAILLLVLVNLGAAEADILFCLQKMEDLFDGE